MTGAEELLRCRRADFCSRDGVYSIMHMLDDCSRRGTELTRTERARGSATLMLVSRWSLLGRRRHRRRMTDKVSGCDSGLTALLSPLCAETDPLSLSPTAEKAARSYQTAMEDMHIAKNQFLIDTDTANVAKARLYNSDLPSLHDDFQLLSASTINQLVDLLRKLCTTQRESLTRLQGSVDLSEQAVSSIDVHRDQELFVTMHSASKLGGWEVPPDLGFEECPVWHDTASWERSARENLG